jgi:fructose-bisphosphate aldolase class II
MGGYNTVFSMIEGLVKDLDISIPVAIHMDHGGYEECQKAIEAGFSSIMFDGSHLPFEENIEKTKYFKTITNQKNLSLEVGIIGGEEDGIIGDDGELADPDQCKIMQDIGVDFLAAGIGNIHGPYPEN